MQKPYFLLERGKTIYGRESPHSKGKPSILLLNPPFYRFIGLIFRSTESVWTIIWECQTRANLIKKEMLEKLKSAGCIRINIGVEAGNQAILDSIKKGVTLPQIRNAARLIKDAGIELRSFFIIGYPQETEQTIEDTKRVIRELHSDYNHVYLLVPLPGSELFNQVLRENKLITRNWFYYYFQNPNVFHRDYMSNEELYNHFVTLKHWLDEERRTRLRKKVINLKYIYSKTRNNIASPKKMLGLFKNFVKLLLKKVK